MEWSNLLEHCCPICEHRLIQRDNWWECEQKAGFFQKCKFTISNEKFQNICADMETQDDEDFAQEREGYGDWGQPF